LAQMNHSELSHMAGAVDDSTINIVVVIIIIIIIIIIHDHHQQKKWNSGPTEGLGM